MVNFVLKLLLYYLEYTEQLKQSISEHREIIIFISSLFV